MSEVDAVRGERDELRKERDRLRSILEASKAALGPGAASSDEELPKRILELGSGLADGAGRIEALERALARIRDRAVGKLPELESPPDNRLLTIHVVAVLALDGSEPPGFGAPRR